ncbi:hypothetical protein GCM10009067_41830 [Haloarcula sebkhae]|uniref:Uncharacterized protein n=1 Tax=Haloarcula sebkhae TaxID=932660 RepID=A0A830EXK8_9EURY|nr:hypothetical protein GCM10009067_41830 [Haloarcula sebkhae]
MKEAGYLSSTTDSEPSDIRDRGGHGWRIGLKTLVWDAVQENSNPSDYEPKTHPATIHYDLNAWDFVIEYLIEEGHRTRVIYPPFEVCSVSREHRS